MQFSPIFDGQSRVTKIGRGLHPVDPDTRDYILVRPEDVHMEIAAK
jgi:hypothetical protein